MSWFRRLVSWCVPRRRATPGSRYPEALDPPAAWNRGLGPDITLVSRNDALSSSDALRTLRAIAAELEARHPIPSQPEESHDARCASTEAPMTDSLDTVTLSLTITLSREDRALLHQWQTAEQKTLADAVTTAIQYLLDQRVSTTLSAVDHRNAAI